MKIAMLSVHSCPMGELGTKDTGGMSVYICELANELGLRGHRVDIFTRSHNPADKEIYDLSENVRLIHIEAGDTGYMQKLAIYPYLDDFFRAMDSFRRAEGKTYDLVHSHYWLSGCVGRRAGREWGVPHVLTFHTIGAVKNAVGVGEAEPQLRIETEKELAQSAYVLATTSQEKLDLVRYYNCRPKQIGVVPCGVNLDVFQPVGRDSVRQKYGLSSEEKILLYVGRIDPIKGLDRLLEAVACLSDRNPVKLIIVGGNDDRRAEQDKLKALAESLHIRESVIFAGRVEQENLPAYYCTADVFVLTSYHESFGLVALEALACGTPVAATRVGGLESMIESRVNGILAADNDPQELADKISVLLQDATSPPVPKEAGPQSIRKSITRFGWSHIAGRIVGQYESLR